MKNSKEGTVSVFLLLVLSCMLMVLGVFLYHGVQLASRSYADAVLEMSGRSVLSEYDTVLLDRYGIFGVYLDERIAEHKIIEYASSSFEKKEGPFDQNNSIDLLHLSVESIEVDLKGFSLLDLDVFQTQIVKSIEFDMVKNVMSKKDMNQTGSSAEENHKLLNQKVIQGLPSYGYEAKYLDIKNLYEKGIPDFDKVICSSGEMFLVDQYILSHFKHHQNHNARNHTPTFFNNEVEYIISGEFQDEDSYHTVRSQLKILRTLLNLTHIYSDAEKRTEVITLAEILTPGPASAITQGVISGIWAAAEAENDICRIEDGKKVALFKTKFQWALALENVINQKDKGRVNHYSERIENGEIDENIGLSHELQNNINNKKSYIEPQNEDGLDYESYLRMLLYLEKREIKLLRTMDLIQIDMKTSYDKHFSLREYYSGFSFTAIVSGESYFYEEKYE